MSTLTELNYEVIYRILELLPTIDEALQHMQFQLEELRLEESALLFEDTLGAISSVVFNVQPLINPDCEQHFLESTAEIRKEITKVIDVYELNDLLAIQRALLNRLIPTFISWRQELEQILRPFVLI